MNEIKLFFVDLDGTLLDDRRDGQKSISDRNLNALKEAKSKGLQIVISTGRIGPKAHHWLKQSGLDYAILGNGSQIIDKDLNVIQELRMNETQLKEIISFCQNHNLALKIDNLRVAYGACDDIHCLLANELDYSIRRDYDINLQTPIKIIVWGQKPLVLQEMAMEMAQSIKGLSVVMAERGRTIEVTHECATKGLGNKFLMDLLEVPKSQTAHIGDTMNDFPAIDYVGRFIAMGDAAPELLAVAEYIGPNHFDHGVARVIEGEYFKNPFKK